MMPKAKAITHIIIPNHKMLPWDESAASRDVTMFAQLMPGNMDINMMFKHYTLLLEGRASSTCCKCHINIVMQRAHWPFVSSDGDDDDDDDNVEDGDVVNTQAAGAWIDKSD